MACPSCAAEVPADARFCPACGHALQVQADERRVVTVLFGDIVGFTTLAETRDPEQVKNLIDRCFARLAADIRAFGGVLDKVVGDAMVALFGAPVAHEDDAERAVRAALQMQRTLSDMQSALGVEVRMRIGVNTGEVLVGALRAGGDYTAMGDVVNTASRLQTSAEPGRVIVGAETYTATSSVFRYEPLGLLRAKGREQAVEAWIVHEAVLQPGRRPPRRTSSRLVGRDVEVEALERLLGGAMDRRRPTLALLLGEAGIGKSRLGEEVVLRLIATHHARVLSGRAVPYGAANAWWPIAEVMRAACGVNPEDGEAEVRAKAELTVAGAVGLAPGDEELERIVQALMYLIGIGATRLELEGKRAQDEVGRAVRTFVEGLAGAQPLVITLGDVQWADPSVLAGLGDMLGRVHRVPLLVLMTARPDLEWRPGVGQQNVVVLHLDPLDDQAAGELLTSLLGKDPGGRARAELVERSGGNPLFVEELAAILAETDGTGALPATLRGIVAARLDALPTRERAVLDDAAVVGRRAPVAAVLALGGARGGVSDAIDELVAKDLLVLDDGQLEFRSDLVREVVYGMLTKGERARRHATLAQWLEVLGGAAPSDEVLVELARHWSTAAELAEELGGIDGISPDVRELAIAALECAAVRAEDRELHLVAHRFFDQLVRLVGEEPSTARRHALVGRARASTALRRDVEATADLEAVQAEAVAEQDDVALARALTVRGDLLRNGGEYDRSLASLEEARVLWQKVGDRRGEGSALRRIGWTKLFAGDLEGAEPVLREALEAFRQAGALRGQAWAIQNLAWVAYGQNDVAEAEARLHDSIQLFRQIGDWGGLNWATGMLGWVRFGQGHVAEAEAHAERALAESREQSDQWQLGMMSVLLASIRLWQGRAEDAVALALEAEQTFTAMDDGWGQLQALGPLARGLLLCGRFDEAEALQTRVEASPATDGLTAYSVFPRFAAVTSAIAVGDGAAALAALDDDLPEPGDARFGIAELLVARGVGLAQVGRTAEATALLLAAVDGSTEPGPRARATAALAVALAADGRSEEALAGAARVLEGDASYSDRAFALVAGAAACARLGRGDDAREALDDAARIVSSTQDRLSPAIVAVARARVMEALGDAFAGGAEADAQSRLHDLGITAAGWNEVFRRATR